MVSTGAADGLSAARPFAWDWPSIVRMAKTLVVVTVVTFVLSVAAATLVPGLPTRLLALIEKVQFWPTTWLTGLWAVFFLILLNNIRAAFTGALIGPASVWLNSRLNTKHEASPDVPGSSIGERIAITMATALTNVGRRIFPPIGDEDLDFAARSSAALAAIVPYMAVGANAIMLGVWLADGLMQGWTAGLLKTAAYLLPHGPVEFPALILSAALGLKLAENLVPRTLDHDSAWQAEKVKRLLKSDRVAQSLGLIVALLLVAAALEVTHWA